MKLKIIYTAVLLFVANLMIGQKCDYFTIPSPNKIEKFIVQDSAIGITDSRGNFIALDLQGNKIELQGGQIDNSSTSNSQNIELISNSVLYYNQKGIRKSVPAPLDYAEKIVRDSKGNIYTIAYDRLWQFDGLNWASFEIVLHQDTTSEDAFNFPCNTINVSYYFEMDKKDKLWVTSSCGMGYGITNFWIDVETKEVRLRATFGKNNVSGKYGVTPFVDKDNNKLLQLDYFLVVLDEDDLFKTKDTIPLSPYYSLGGQTKDSVLYFSNVSDSKLLIQKEGGFQELDPIMTTYLETYPNVHYMRDVNRDLWLYQGLKVYKNDGYKLDSFLISNPNDTLNLCYQEKIKNAFTGDRFLTSLTQDLNNEVFLSQKSCLDNKSQYVLHLDLDNCQNILPSTIIDNSVKDRAGTTWYLTVPRKVSSFNYTVGDSVNLYQYVGDKLVLKHEYKDKSKPLSKLHVVDDFGNVWASYYYDYTPVYGQWGNQISSKWKNKLIKFDGIKWIDYGAIVYGDYECFQGKNNDIWVVKDSLILKFDGVNWSTYLYPEGLRTPLIRMDKNGTVWCFDSEEHNNMIYEFNGLSWVAHQVGKELEGLIVDPVRGGFWVLNLDKTFSYSRNAQDWIHYEYQYDSLLLNVLIDYKGRIWFESEITIDRFDPENSVLGLEDSKSNSALTNLYFPNPVQNNLNLTNIKGENSIEIYSNTGVFLEKYFNSQSINLQHLNKGLYTIKITDSGSVQTDKFYKE